MERGEAPRKAERVTPSASDGWRADCTLSPLHPVKRKLETPGEHSVALQGSYHLALDNGERLDLAAFIVLPDQDLPSVYPWEQRKT